MEEVNTEGSRWLYFLGKGLTTAVFRYFGKMPDESESLTLFSTSISKQLKTLLKKLVGRVSKQQVDEFIKKHYILQSFSISSTVC